MASRLRMLVLLIILAVLAYFAFNFLQSSQQAPAIQGQMLKLWQANEIPFVTSDFDLVAIPESKLTGLHDSLSTLKSRATSDSDKALADLYLTQADLLVLRRQNAVLTQELSALPSAQVCAQLPKFEQSNQNIAQIAQSAVKLSQALQSYSTTYPALAQTLSLSDLQPNLDALQTSYQASLKNVNQLKSLCG